MKNLIALWLSCCAVVSAQTNPLTVTPSQLQLNVRSPKIFPGWRYIPPPKHILTVQAAAGQAWTVNISGSLTTVCLYFSSCFEVTEEYSNNSVTSGTGPMRLAVNWYHSEPPNLDPGAYSGTITFTPAGSGPASTVNVTLQVAGAADLPASPEVKATASSQLGCVNSDPVLSYSYAVRCDIPNEAPTADPALTQPAVGKSFVDPVFGNKITRITDAGCSTEYGTTTAFSVNNTYIWNSCGVYRTDDATQVRGAHANEIFTMMSATDDEVYYHFAGTQIRRYNFVTDQETVLGDYSGPPYNFIGGLYAGGTAPASDDEWIAFYQYAPDQYPKICAVDLLALRAAGVPGPGNTYCSVYAGPQPLTFLDWVATTEVDNSTGKRYVYLSAVPVSAVFSVGPNGSGRLNAEYIVPEWPSWGTNNDDGICLPAERCYNANNFTHNAFFKDRDGQIRMFANFEDILQNRNYLGTYRLSAGLQLLRPEAEGGGLRFMGRMNLDKQPGCSSRIAGCAIAPIETGHRFAARVTVVETDPDRTRLTLSAATGWTAYSLHPVRVQNATGSWRCLNGAWSATVLPGNQVEIPAICMGATGARDKVILGDAAQPFTGTDNDNRSQLQVWRSDRQVHRVAMHRSVVWSDVPGTGISSYESTPRGSISRDGRFIAFASNWGGLDFDGVSVYIAETGLGAPENRITVKELVPSVKGAALSYEVAGGQSCTFEVSADPTFQNLVETFTDTGGTTSRQSFLGRTAPLTASTNYWMRMQCGLEVESKAFRTLDALPSANTVVTVQVGPASDSTVTNVVVGYRPAGTVPFSLSAAQECRTGCQVSWPAALGSVSEYQVFYRDAGANTRFATDLYTVSVRR